MAGSLAAPELFAVIFDRHFDSVYRYVARRIGGGPAAEDVTAETFAVAFSRRGVFDPALGRCSSWLLGIATNLLRRYYRSETRRLVAMARLGTEVIVAVRDQDGLDLWGNAGGLGGALGAGLAALPAAQRDVISLVDGVGLSYHEAAVALGVPLGTVQSRLFRARATVRAHIQSAMSGPTAAERRGIQ